MKQLSILTLLLLSSWTIYCQEKKDEYKAFMKDGIEYKTNGKDTIFIVDPMPEFKGGLEELSKYISSNVKYPKAARKARIEGKVLVSFVVAVDGTIKNCRVTKSVNPKLDKEALRLVNNMPKWKPGKQNGKAIPVSLVLPINFKL